MKPFARHLILAGALACATTPCVAAADIGVTFGPVWIPDSQSPQDFGGTVLPDAVLGQSTQQTFVIGNYGDGTLTVLAGAGEGGLHPEDFAIDFPGGTFTAGETTTMVVTFTPTALGDRSAAFFFTSDDLDENPFTLQVRATSHETAIPAKPDLSGIVRKPFKVKLNKATNRYEATGKVEVYNYGTLTSEGGTIHPWRISGAYFNNSSQWIGDYPMSSVTLAKPGKLPKKRKVKLKKLDVGANPTGTFMLQLLPSEGDSNYSDNILMIPFDANQ